MLRRYATPLIALALAVLAVTVYAGAFDNELVWDDPIVFQRQLPYFDSVARIFFPPRGIPQFPDSYYRPLVFVSYRIDETITRALWDLAGQAEGRRVVYHASCVLMHALATVLVFFCGRAMARAAGSRPVEARGAAAIGGVLFAVHPIHVESVAWMAGRSDLICAIFFFAALWAYIEARRRGGFFLPMLVAIFGLGAMLAKETGVGLVLLIPLADLLVTVSRPVARATTASRAERRRAAPRRDEPGAGSAGRGWPELLAPSLLIIVAALVYGLLRRAALPGGGAALRWEAEAPFRLFAALGWYVRKALWPPPQSAFVADLPGGGHALLGVLALLAALAAVFWSWRRGRGAAERLWVLFFFSSLAPSLAIATARISETPLAERYLYIPSAGLCLLAGALLLRVPGPRTIVATAVTAGLVLPAAAATVARVDVWATDLAFWSDAVARAPDQGLPHMQLGMRYARMGEHEKAVEQYERALVTYDDAEGRSKTYNNLASLRIGQGRYEEAIRHLGAALAEMPGYATAHYNMGLALLSLGSEKERPNEKIPLLKRGMHHLERALEINPRYTRAHLHYGRMLLQLRREEEGRRHLEQVLRLDPGSEEAAVARRALGR